MEVWIYSTDEETIYVRSNYFDQAAQRLGFNDTRKSILVSVYVTVILFSGWPDGNSVYLGV